MLAVYVCPGCGYRFDEATGDAHEGYPPATPFDSLPDDFACPDCGVRYKEDFVREEPGTRKG
jgi:rubredoxin